MQMQDEFLNQALYYEDPHYQFFTTNPLYNVAMFEQALPLQPSQLQMFSDQRVQSRMSVGSRGGGNPPTFLNNSPSSWFPDLNPAIPTLGYENDQREIDKLDDDMLRILNQYDRVENPFMNHPVPNLVENEVFDVGHEILDILTLETDIPASSHAGQSTHKEVLQSLENFLMQKKDRNLQVTTEDPIQHEYDILEYITNADLPVTPCEETRQVTGIDVQSEKSCGTGSLSPKRRGEPLSPGKEKKSKNKTNDSEEDKKKRGRDASKKSRDQKKAREKLKKEECDELQKKNNTLKIQEGELLEAITKIINFLKNDQIPTSNQENTVYTNI